MKLVIDDLRNPAFDCLLARTVEAGLKALRENPSLEELWLDHDLGWGVSIMPVVDWLLERAVWDDPVDVGIIYVHTMNPSAARTMMSCLGKHYRVGRVLLSEYNSWLDDEKPTYQLVTVE